MTLFEIFLAFFGIFLMIFSVFGLQNRISFVLRFFILLVGMSLVIFTIFPHFLTFLGSVFGLERGADLLVYASVSFLFFMVLFLLRERSILWEKITKIVREMAISEIFSKNFGEKKFAKIAIVMPVFNEEKVLSETIEKIFDFDKNFFLIVVNDGSSDGSFGILKNLEKKFENIFVVSHSQNLGQWAALETGFEIIRRGIIDTELVATFDSDGQMNITDLPKMAEILEKNREIDIILGSRFLDKKPENMPFFRKIIIKMGIIFTRIISGISLSDTHNGYRVFRKKILSKMRISLDGMGHASEILDIISREKIAFREFGVNISYTEYSLDKGQNSGNSIRIAVKMLLRKFF